eukprot:1159184-Pelagomonas_calceolata.AAC.10
MCIHNARFVRPVAESARKLVSGPEQSPEAAAAGRGLALAPEVHAEFTGEIQAYSDPGAGSFLI